MGDEEIRASLEGQDGSTLGMMTLTEYSVQGF